MGSGQGSKSPPEDDWFDLLDEAPTGTPPKAAPVRPPETAHTKVTPIAVSPLSPGHPPHSDDLWDWEIDPKPPKAPVVPKDSGPKTMSPPDAFETPGPELDLMDLSVDPFHSGDRSFDTVRPDATPPASDVTGQVEEIDASDFSDTENWQFDPIAAASQPLPPPGLPPRLTPPAPEAPTARSGTLPFPEPDPGILAQQNAHRIQSPLEALEFESNRPPPPGLWSPPPASPQPFSPPPLAQPSAPSISTLDLIQPPPGLGPAGFSEPSDTAPPPTSNAPPAAAGSIRAGMAPARNANTRIKATQAFVLPLPPEVPTPPSDPSRAAPAQPLPGRLSPPPLNAPAEVPLPPGATRASSPPVSPRAVAAPIVNAPALQPAEDPTPDRRADMRARFDAGDFAGALLLSESLLQSNPRDPDARQVSDVSRQKLRGIYAGRLGNLQQIPRVIVPHSELRWLSLDHRAGFILSLIDGSLTLEDIIDVSSMPALEVLRTLYNLSVQRVIELRPPRR